MIKYQWIKTALGKNGLFDLQFQITVQSWEDVKEGPGGITSTNTVKSEDNKRTFVSYSHSNSFSLSDRVQEFLLQWAKSFNISQQSRQHSVDMPRNEIYKEFTLLQLFTEGSKLWLVDL